MSKSHWFLIGSILLAVVLVAPGKDIPSTDRHRDIGDIRLIDHCVTPQRVYVPPAQVKQQEKVIVKDGYADQVAYGPQFNNVEALLLKMILAQEQQTLAIQGMHRDLLISQGKNPGALGVGAALSRDNVVKRNCASCHNEEVADRDGDGFLMVRKDGSIVEFDNRNKRRIADKLRSGAMPKGKNDMSPQEREYLIREYDK